MEVQKSWRVSRYFPQVLKFRSSTTSTRQSAPVARITERNVLLVQYLLITINNNANVFSPPLAPLPLSPSEIFRPDGVVGPITLRAIKHFQEAGKARGNNIAEDGRVDKATGSGIGSLSHTQYTIIFLNNGYRIARPGAFKNIAILSGDCPAELRAAFTLS